MIFQILRDILFPITCLCCRRPASTPICEACEDCSPIRTTHTCPVCQKAETLHGSVCTKCFGKTPLEGIFSATPYERQAIRRKIHTYKYSFARSMARPLSKTLLRAIERTDLALPDSIIPVPLHKRRLRLRGFNQAELLARHLSRDLLIANQIPVETDVLTRHRYTAPQARTESRAARRKNLKSAFTVTDPKRVIGKRIWLIDDVATTGSTLSECARALRRADAKEIWGIVLAG